MKAIILAMAVALPGLALAAEQTSSPNSHFVESPVPEHHPLRVMSLPVKRIGKTHWEKQGDAFGGYFSYNLNYRGRVDRALGIKDLQVTPKGTFKRILANVLLRTDGKDRLLVALSAIKTTVRTRHGSTLTRTADGQRAVRVKATPKKLPR